VNTTNLPSALRCGWLASPLMKAPKQLTHDVFSVSKSLT
jgi:hypothetical protein